MKAIEIPILLLGFGVAMCGPKEHPRPSTLAKAEPAVSAAKTPPEEKNMTEARWIEVSAASQRFLIVKIADAVNRPEGDFDGMDAYAGPLAKQNASKVVYYILVPNSSASAEITHAFGGKQAALPKSKMINRMPGSALYTHFLADPAQPGSLVLRAGGKAETIDLSTFSATLGKLPFFWSGSPPAVAFEDVPGWMESTGP